MKLINAVADRWDRFMGSAWALGTGIALALAGPCLMIFSFAVFGPENGSGAVLFIFAVEVMLGGIIMIFSWMGHGIEYW